MDKVMLVLFVVMFGGLGVMLLVVGVKELVLQRRIVASAVPVEAVILSAEVVSSTSRDSDYRLLRDNSTTSHRPEVRFAYAVDGVRYESDLLYPTVILQGYASRESAAEEIREYVAGAAVRAFVDPSIPQRGFLRLKSTSNPVWFMVAGLLTLVFLAVVSRFL